MRFNQIVLIFLLILFAVSPAGSNPRQAQQPPVVMYLTSDSCVEPIGGNISSMLREKVRGSKGYVLAEKPPFPSNALGPEIMLMCTDVMGQPVTAVSYLISFRVGRTRDIALNGLDIIGRAKVDEEAQTIFSQFDNWWTEFSATQDYYKKK